MARPLIAYDADVAAPVESESKRRLDRSTGRALAAAVAALAIAAFVVSESSAALNPQGTASSNEFESGTVALVDDDAGRSLVTLDDMAPGRPVERCITVTYTGSVLPVAVTLGARTSGDIAEFLLVRVERGTAGGFDDCSRFVPDATVYDGSLGALADTGAAPVGAIRSQSESMSFRFRFDLVDTDAAEGRAGSIDFVWEAIPA